MGEPGWYGCGLGAELAMVVWVWIGALGWWRCGLGAELARVVWVWIEGARMVCK